MIITTTQLDLVQVGLTILGSRVTLAVDNLRQASSRFGLLIIIIILSQATNSPSSWFLFSSSSSQPEQWHLSSSSSWSWSYHRQHPCCHSLDPPPPHHQHSPISSPARAVTPLWETSPSTASSIWAVSHLGDHPHQHYHHQQRRHLIYYKISNFVPGTPQSCPLLPYLVLSLNQDSVERCLSSLSSSSSPQSSPKIFS